MLAAQLPDGQGRAGRLPDGRCTAMPNGVVSNPKIFVSIGKDGIVSIVAARAEMGNGAARTALPMIVADELDADWARVRVVQSPGDEKTYGNQDTDGSRSVRHFIQPMRQCGAAARAMLETAAAKKWSVDVSEVEAAVARGRAQALGPQARLRRAGRRCRGCCPCRRTTRSSSRKRAPSATSARATCRIADSSTSPPARRSTART